MALDLGALVARVELDMDGLKGSKTEFQKQTRGIGDEAEKAGKTSGKRFGGAMKAGIAALGLGAAIGKSIGFLKDAFGEATEARKIGAITEQAIKTTGAAAGVTADQVGELAGAISTKTGMDDEAVQSASNLLLTMSNVRNEVGKGNDIFNRATKSATDMAAAMGTEPRAAAKTLGKALNDPLKGLTALSKAGVTFTKEQQDQVKALMESGNVLGAQKVILDEVGKRYDGAAAKASTPAEKATVAWGNLKEQIGTGLMPMFDKVSRVLTKDIIPAVSGFVQGIQDGTGAGGTFRSVLTGVWTTVSTLVGWLYKNRDILVPLVAIVGGAIGAYKVVTGAIAAWRTAQLLLNAAMLLNPIGLVIAAVVGVVAIIVIAYKKSETFRGVVHGLWDAMKSLGGWLKRAFVASVEAVVKAVDTVDRKFDQMIRWVGKIPGRIAAKASGMWDSIKDSVSDAKDWGIAKLTELVDYAKSIPSRIGNGVLDAIPGGGTVKKGIDAMQGIDVPFFARGGIVTKPTLAMVGEDGDEAIVPRQRLESLLAGGGGGPQKVENHYHFQETLTGSRTDNLRSGRALANRNRRGL